MTALFRTDSEYLRCTGQYTIADGIKAVALFLFCFVSVYVLGLLCLTNLSVAFLNAANYISYVIQLLVCLLLLWISRQGASSVGLTGTNLGKSMGFGLIGTVVFALCVLGLHVAFGEAQFGLQRIPLTITLSFLFFAIQEEIIYRGYIQPRMMALIPNPAVSTILTAVLFLLAHYPVKWAAIGSFSLTILPPFYVICLLLLHFFCDWVYRTTNCLYGAILLHFLYNIFSAMLLAS